MTAMLSASLHVNIKSLEYDVTTQSEHTLRNATKFHEANEHKHTYTHTQSWLLRLKAGKADLALAWILLFSASQILPLDMSHKNTRTHSNTHTHANCRADSLFSAVLSASRGNSTVRGRKLVAR